MPHIQRTTALLLLPGWFFLAWMVFPASIWANNSANNSANSLAHIPAPIPTGMDLLFGDRVALNAQGEPQVVVGVRQKMHKVGFRASIPLTLDFFHKDLAKSTQVPANTQVHIELLDARPASMTHHVALQSFPYANTQALKDAIAIWKKRGVGPIKIYQEGLVLSLAGKTIDGRRKQLSIPCANARAAEILAQKIFQTWRFRAQTGVRYLNRPWGQLRIQVAGAQPLVMRATSFVRLSPTGSVAAPIHVEDLPPYRATKSQRAASAYHGQLYATVAADGSLAVVNKVGVEEILRGVVPAEIFASAPMEALKAQAVAARNTLLAKLAHRHHGDPFSLCNTQHCQMYLGAGHAHPRTDKAIAATYGQVLFLNGKLVDAVYSSTCGGHTENNEAVWGNTPDPALRGRPDWDTQAHPELQPFIRGITNDNIHAWVDASPKAFCAPKPSASQSRFRWQRTFNQASLMQYLQKIKPKLGPLRDLKIHARGPGGRITHLEFIGSQARHVETRELAIRRLLGNLKSGAFALQPFATQNDSIPSTITLHGAGWGHGVGMCQMGAIGRAKAGYLSTDILEYYYNGALLESLYLPSQTAAPTLQIQ